MTNSEEKNKIGENELLLEQWKKAIELYQRSSEHIHQKMNYFIVINVALLSGFGYVLLYTPTKELKLSHAVIKLFIPSLGLLISLVWMLIHRKEQYYSIFRVEQAKKIEEIFVIENDLDFDLMCESFDDWTSKLPKNKIKKFFCKISKKSRFINHRSNTLIFILYWFFIGVWGIALIYSSPLAMIIFLIVSVIVKFANSL